MENFQKNLGHKKQNRVNIQDFRAIWRLSTNTKTEIWGDFGCFLAIFSPESHQIPICVFVKSLQIALKSWIFIRFCSLGSTYFKNFPYFANFIFLEVDNSVCLFPTNIYENSKNFHFLAYVGAIFPWETDKLKFSTSENMIFAKFIKFLKNLRY